MRRIQPPLCTVCNKQRAIFESDVWLSLKLCNDCWHSACEFICRSTYDQGNPVLIELLRGTDNDERSDSLRMWRQRPNESGAYYEYRVKLDSDSKNNFENPLDILDQVCLDSHYEDVISELPVIPGLLTGLE